MAQVTKEINVPIKAIGCGQGGSNLIAAGSHLGLFEQIAAINTTTADDMAVPNTNQILCLNPDNAKRGAGKDALKGAELFMDNLQTVKERLGMIFNSGSEDAFYMISTALGGGSGTGIANRLAQVLRMGMGDYPSPLLGLMTLPEDSFVEQQVSKNALMALEEARTKKLYDTLFLIDNNKVYDRVRIGDSLAKINQKIWRPLAHTLHYVGRKSTATMDVEDFERLLKRGRCGAIYEACVSSDITTLEELREFVLQSWAKDRHFYTEEHSNPQRLIDDKYDYGFGLLIGVPSGMIERKRSLFEGLYSSLTILLKNPSSYRGFVPDDTLSNQFRIITIFTGLPYPIERIQGIADYVKRVPVAIDDTPSFLDGIEKAALFGQPAVQRSDKESFDMLSLVAAANEKSQESQINNSFDTSMFLRPASNGKKKRGGLSF